MRNSLYWLMSLWLVLASCLSIAHADDDFLPPEQAFHFSARMVDANTVEVSFRIAEGYYMYRERLGFKADGATLGKADIPRGKVKFDPNFEKDVETFRQQLTIRIPVQSVGNQFALRVASQGCSDKGLCYAPMESVARLSVPSVSEDPAASSSPATSDVGAMNDKPDAAQNSSQNTEMGRIEATLATRSLSVIVPLFLLLGLGLSFTPCVLPMVPILSFIIVGEGSRASRKRGFVLSLAYALGMAVVYTALGIAAGLIGEG